MHVLITRPEPDASEMRDALAREGHTADVAPLLEIALEPPPVEVFEGIAGLVVTSRNGLRAILRARRCRSSCTCPCSWSARVPRRRRANSASPT